MKEKFSDSEEDQDSPEILDFPELDPEMEYKLRKYPQWKLPTLFKLSRCSINGNPKKLFWEIGFDGDELIVRHGYVDGKIVVNPVEVSRKRGDTEQEKAWEEAKSKYNEKITKKGYTLDENLAEQSLDLMQAQKYSKDIWKTWEDVGISPKLDGIRVRMTYRKGKLKAISRQNKELKLTHLIESSKKLLDKLPEGSQLDGEAYWHGKKFQELSGIIRRSKNESTKIRNIKYVIFDWIPPPDLHLTYKERIKKLVKIYGNIYETTLTTNPNGDPEFNDLLILSYIDIGSHKELLSYHKIFIDWGFEGTIIRNLDKPYTHGRCKWLLKHKDFIDAEFPVVDIKKAKGTRKDAAIFICEFEGKKFNATMKGSIKKSKRIYKNKVKYIGKMLTVTYQELTNAGVPRFGVAKEIRDYE